ncbi:CPXCG motif-containing cysteine-rich protein [Hydrogenimonas sp. SS33]|uniref:CPXCG motif-containing cysteine-rich protein n=1 Tax=Hydrogenimonas leucolamina TaxID=2954236 RepID=UPI00336BBA83
MIEHFFTCPYCWQRISILIDGGLPFFEGVEDCEVCCRPITVTARIEEGRIVMFRYEKA